MTNLEQVSVPLPAMNLPLVSDIDAQLRGVAELRALLDGLGSCIGSMRAVLARREQALMDCREELIAHATDLAARAAEQQRVA
jgi:hypothetical protein